MSINNYEDDSDLDWMRHVFQGGASATAANDNWVGIDYGYDASHRLTSTSATDSRIIGAIPTAGAYGAANALNQVASVPNREPMTWSDAGNMQTDGKGTTFVHDGNNRLIKATKANSDTYHFRYDGDGLRMETIKNPTGTNDNFQHTGGTKTRYVTSATEEIADLDGNRIVLRRYIAGPAIDERVAQVDATGNVTYIHTDKQNSVVALSNSSGTATSRRGYGTYGETNASQMAETTHPFGYTGRRWESELGLYYYRARWYDPELGTFLQTDPIGSLDYINLYSYVGLNPMNATDPTGMEDFFIGGQFDDIPFVGGSVKGYISNYQSRNNNRVVSYHPHQSTSLRSGLANASKRNEPINIVCHSRGCATAMKEIYISGVKVDNLISIDPVNDDLGNKFNGYRPSNIVNWINVEGEIPTAESNLSDTVESKGEQISGDYDTSRSDTEIQIKSNHNDFGRMFGDLEEVFDDTYSKKE